MVSSTDLMSSNSDTIVFPAEAKRQIKTCRKWKYFFEQTKFENLYRIKLIDNGINLQDDFLQRFQPDILNIVMTSLNHDDKQYGFLSKSLKRLEIELFIGENAKKYF